MLDNPWVEATTEQPDMSTNSIEPEDDFTVEDKDEE